MSDVENQEDISKELKANEKLQKQSVRSKLLNLRLTGSHTTHIVCLWAGEEHKGGLRQSFRTTVTGASGARAYEVEHNSKQIKTLAKLQPT